MRACIHRGAREIGGSCVEIEADGRRLVLDVGLPLDAPDAESVALPPVAGFDSPDDSLEGVVLSHSHPDHLGLARRLPAETLFLMGAATESILKAATIFTPSAPPPRRVRHLENRREIELGPFRITPFLVDHSAYDAYAILVEARGRRLLYSGDFRMHGRKHAMMERFLENPPRDVHALLMEGTTLGRVAPWADTMLKSSRSIRGTATGDSWAFRASHSIQADKG